MKASNPLVFKPQKSHVGRNAFDMSYHSYFTTPVGMLLPCYVQDVQPGDYMKLNVSNFTRTAPVNTAAFCRLQESTDFYFVPYRLIWRWFDEFITSTTNQSSSYTPFTSGTLVSKLPSISGGDLLDLLCTGTSSFYQVDIFGYSKAYYVLRLLDLLGYSSDSIPLPAEVQDLPIQLLTDFSFLDNLSFNPFRLFAFQRIYNDFYRNSDYETNNPSSYNCDNLSSGGTVSKLVLGDLFTPRYKNWAKDHFTSIKPSPLYTASSSINNFVGTSPKLSIDGDTFVTEDTVGDTGYSVASIRNAFALDKLARLSMLAPKTYKDQLETHFGVKPDNCDYCSCRYLGSFQSNVNIGEVTATANGTAGDSSNVLGQIAGKGISSSSTNRPISGQFNEHGIVMGIHYVIPQAEYDSNRIDRFNTKSSRADYYASEYDNLGLQPIYGTELKQTLTNGVSLGWQSRYMEYKTRVSEVHGEFQGGVGGRSLSTWCIPRDVSLDSTHVFSVTDLKVNPSVVSSIFTMAFDGHEDSDPFWCHFNFGCTLVRNMSVFGLPNL